MDGVEGTFYEGERFQLLFNPLDSPSKIQS